MTDTSTSRQRTRLARLRTASGFLVLSIFLLRQGVTRGTALDLTAALLALACAVACAWTRAGVQAQPISLRRIRVLTVVVLVISGLALAGALAGRP